jgi:trk system potassium uptake protein TrkH
VDLRPVFFVLGILLTIMSFSLVLPMLADLYFGYADWKVFFFCIIITAFFGGSLILSNSGKAFSLTRRQAFVLVTLSWLTIAIFGALPFRFSELDMSTADAFFESMSGITTTGATVITGLQDAPAGILLWRAIMQWLGGIGIIVMSATVLPFLRVGGMQLFNTESSQDEKAVPRALQFAGAITLLYLGLSTICAIAYMATGLGTFDAIAHAMTTISTGGFSTNDASFTAYDHIWTEIVAIIFMILGAMPFVLFLRVAQGDTGALARDSQVRVLLMFLLAATLALVIYLVLYMGLGTGEAIRRGAFNVVSVMTGTGFNNHDYDSWGVFPVCLFLFLMVIGGCAGSTTSGLKVFRFEVLYAVVAVEIKKLLHPNGIFTAKYNGKRLPEDVPLSVMNFFFVFAFFFLLIAAALSAVGLDLLTAISGAAASVANSGIGLGELVGPGSTFQTIPESAKWILSAGMLIGRLEIITVLVMLSPYFWKT